MVAHGDTYKTLAEFLDITVSTLSKKVNEKRQAGFNQQEIMMIKNRYSLNAEDVDSIFFENQVS